MKSVENRNPDPPEPQPSRPAEPPPSEWPPAPPPGIVTESVPKPTKRPSERPLANPERR